MKTLKKTVIIVVLTLICIIIFNNYNHNKSIKKLEQAGKEETTADQTAEEEEISNYVTFLALGQNLMNDSVINSGKQEDGSYNYDYIFNGITGYLQEADLSALCQGSVIGGNSLGISGYPQFNAPEELCDAVANAGIDTVAMANVRVNNLGSAAVSTCLSVWHSKAPEVQVLGIHDSAEENHYTIIEKNGLKIAFLDYTAVINTAISNEEAYKIDFFGNYSGGSADLQTLSDTTKADLDAAAKASDFVVVFASWGLEDTHEISATQERFAKQLTEAGADLIIGNRPNYLQKVEWVTADNGNRALCFYSLGNLVSSETTPDALLGGIAKVGIKVENGLTVIDEENTGLIPVVTQYTYSGSGNEVQVEGAVPFTAYTDEMAAAHGIIAKKGITFNRDVLQQILNGSVDAGFILHN